jgi:putative copper resistance protein D
MLRLLGLGLLIAGLFLGRMGLWISTLGGCIAVWSFNHVGHISGRDTMLLDIALTLHLLAIAFWIGVLMPLKRLASASVTYASAADVGHRFGRIASIAVPVLIIVGGYMSYQLVGSFTALVGTGYGQALIIKVVLVGGLLGLAAANKLRFIPALRAGDPNAANHLAQSIMVEWLVVLAILGTTSVLTTNLTLPT